MKLRRVSFLALIAPSLLLWSFSSRSSSVGRAAPGARKPYLLLLTFYARNILDFTFTPAMLSEFSKSPYDGMAVQLVSGDERTRVPSPGEIEPKLLRLKEATGKDIWPWVFLNRMIGANPAQPKPGLNFYGWDLDDTHGAQSAFFSTWRLAFRMAKELGTPGVVGDLEPYNNYPSYEIAGLARQTQKTPEQVIALLKTIGTRMADNAAQELPGAKVWFLETSLYRPNPHPYQFASYYVVIGMLDRIQQAGLNITVISGQEQSLGYCHESPESLRSHIKENFSHYSPYLKKYAGVFQLGGTIALWRDAAAKTGWLNSGRCGASTAQGVEDLDIDGHEY